MVGTSAATPLAAAVLGALALAGCGNGATPSPDVGTPGPAFGVKRADFPIAGVALDVPVGWAVRRGAGDLVVSATTARASIAIFRYARVEPLPSTRASLDAAAGAIVDAAKVRDPTFTEVKRGRLRVAGSPAVAIRGTGTLLGQPRTLRSTHVYFQGAEYVVDAFAPARDFARVDAQVFRPLVRSLDLRTPGTAATGPAGASGATGASAATGASGPTGLSGPAGAAAPSVTGSGGPPRRGGPNDAPTGGGRPRSGVTPPAGPAG